MNQDSIHAFTDASVKGRYGVTIEVYAAIILVDGDHVVGHRVRMPQIVNGVGIGLTSSAGEQWAVIQAVLLADPTRPLTVFSDVVASARNSKASVAILNELYDKAVATRVMPTERVLLPIPERNRGFHKWAHQLARGDIQARKIEGKAVYMVKKRLYEAARLLSPPPPFFDTGPTQLELAIIKWPNDNPVPGVGHTYY